MEPNCQTMTPQNKASEIQNLSQRISVIFIIILEGLGSMSPSTAIIVVYLVPRGLGGYYTGQIEPAVNMS